MILFTQADPKDHKSVDIYTFNPKMERDWIKHLEAYINTITKHQDRLIDNYLTIDWFEQIAISLFLRDNNIVGFSTVWNRDFYGPNTVRIFNRWWEDPSLRQTSKIIGDSHLIAVAKHQLQVAQEDGFNWAFISRETTPKYLKKVVNILNNETNFQWLFHNKKIAVCYPKAKTCWQWVGYTNLKNSNDPWEMLK